MEKEYQKTIHHICQLIAHRNFRRALNIIKFVIEQGIHNSEITVLHAYCIRKINGGNHALQILKKSKNKSPMIDMALAQFEKENKGYFRTHILMKKVSQLFDGYKGMTQNPILHQAFESVQVVADGDKRPNNYQGRYGNLNVEAINAINRIVYEYKAENCRKRALQQLRRVREDFVLQKGLLQYVCKFIQFLKCEQKKSINS